MAVSPEERAHAERARERAGIVLQPGDKIRVSRCGGLRSYYTFDGWDGHWAVSSSGINDLSPRSIDMLNGRPISFQDPPKDGTIACLLVDYSGEAADHPLNDTARLAWTIGHNNFANDGEDRWQFAGWCWSHDHYTQGRGVVVAWAPWEMAKISGEA